MSERGDYTDATADGNDVRDFELPDDESDIVLKVEGRKLYVHKQILCVSSPVFKAMFRGNFRDANEQEIDLPGKSIDSVKTFLRCIYPSTFPGRSACQITDDNVDDLVALADEYQVEKLRKECEDVLKISITTENMMCVDEFERLVQLFCKYRLDDECMIKCEQVMLKVFKTKELLKRLSVQDGLRYLQTAKGTIMHDLLKEIIDRLHAGTNPNKFLRFKDGCTEDDVYTVLHLAEQWEDEDLLDIGVRWAMDSFSIEQLENLYDDEEISRNVVKRIVFGKIRQLSNKSGNN